MINPYFHQLIQESKQKEKKKLAKQNELSLIRVDKVLKLSLITFNMWIRK